MPVRFQQHGNPLYPLPPDYETLDSEGKRLARVNAVQLREKPDEDVTSWEFFREYYLRPDDAGWYSDYVEPAPGHYEWVRVCATYPRVVIGAHRGSAKSTIFSGEFTLRDLVAAPGSRTLLILATQDKVARWFSTIMRQLECNKRIIEDFGALKPKRLAGIWNHSCLEPTNGAMLIGSSVGAKSLRGERLSAGGRVIIDDPEFDPKAGTNIDKLIEDLDVTLFQVVLPMLRRGASLHWIGTPIRRRLFLWRMIMNEVQDPRIDPARWYRKIYPGCNTDLTGAFWPSEYPPEVIEQKKRELGSAWGAEFMCCPASEDEAPLRIHPKHNLYDLVDKKATDPMRAEDPLSCPSKISWYDCRTEKDGSFSVSPRELPASELFTDMTRFITVDPIRVPSHTSDWAVAQVIGIDRLGHRFSLDLWKGKVRYSALCSQVWKLAHRWKVKFIGVEAIAMEREMLQLMRETAGQFSERFGWVPQIVPITYPSGIEKADRIQAMESFFNRGQVKLPAWCRYSDPYQSLYSQIELFTPGLENLEHDDCVDTLAMAFELTKRRQVRKGDRYYPDTNMPLGQFVNPQATPIAEIKAYIDRQQPEYIRRPGRTRAWRSAAL
jgi:phage terminase large subunit-like protein